MEKRVGLGFHVNLPAGVELAFVQAEFGSRVGPTSFSSVI